MYINKRTSKAKPNSVAVEVKGLVDETSPELTKIKHLLYEANVSMIDIVSMSDEDILSIKGVGKATLRTIRSITSEN